MFDLRGEIDAIMGDLNQGNETEGLLVRDLDRGLVVQGGADEDARRDASDVFRAAAADNAAALGMTIQQVGQLNAAFGAMDGAGSLTEIRDAAAEAQKVIALIWSDTQVPPALRDMVNGLDTVTRAAAQAVVVQGAAPVSPETERQAEIDAVRNRNIFERHSLLDDERGSQAAIRSEMEAILALQARDTATAKETLAGLQGQLALQIMIAEFGADSVAVTRLRAQMERAADEETVNSSTAAQDLKAELMASYDAWSRVASENAASAIAAAADEAARLTGNLAAAVGALAGIERAVANLGIANIGDRAQLAALQAGRTAADANAAATMAEAPANLAPALAATSPDGLRYAAQRELAQLEAGLAEQVRLAAGIAAFTNIGAGAGAGGGGSAGVSDLERLTRQAQAVLTQLGLRVDTVAVKLDAGLMTGAEGADEVGSATRRAAEALAGMIAEADALGPAGAAAAAQFRTELEGLIPQIEAVGSTLQSELADNFKSSFVNALTGGQNTFGAFADFLKRKLAELAYDRFISPMLTPLFDGLAGLFGSAKGNVIPFARGGLPGIDAFENQIVARPTLFGMGGNRTGLMGEAGAEAIMPMLGGAGGGVQAVLPDGSTGVLPLTRGPGGILSVALPSPHAAGGMMGGSPADFGISLPTRRARGGAANGGPPQQERGGGGVVINIVNKFDAAQTRTEERAEGGQRIVDVFIEQVKGALMSDVATGGPFGQQIAGTFGTSRQGR